MKSIIKRKVQDLTMKYNTDDPFYIAEALNINVIFYPLHERINGIYYYNCNKKAIVINRSLPSFLQKLVCAHELGHAILDPTQNYFFLREYTLFSIDKLDRHANLFAAEMLISDNRLLSYVDYTVKEVSAIEKIPHEFLELKLELMH